MSVVVGVEMRVVVGVEMSVVASVSEGSGEGGVEAWRLGGAAARAGVRHTMRVGARIRARARVGVEPNVGVGAARCDEGRLGGVALLVMGGRRTNPRSELAHVLRKGDKGEDAQARLDGGGEGVGGHAPNRRALRRGKANEQLCGVEIVTDPS